MQANLISMVALSLVQIINFERRLIRRRRKSKVNLKIMKFLISELKSQKNIDRTRPREWAYQKSSTFLEDALTWPDDIFSRRFRMGKLTFEELCEKLKPQMEKKKLIRKPVPLKERVAIALFCLKSGSDYRVISDVYGVSATTVCRIVDEFLETMINVYYKDQIKFPISPEGQQVVADQFELMWKFPNCIGALDGCHIPILTPEEDGPDYFNYKQFHSIVLLGLVDSHYRFLNINVGQPGKVGDGGVFQSSLLGKSIHEIVHEPFHLIADSAFPISNKLLKPFPGDMLPEYRNYFNYRLSSTRMVVESAFGRLKGRWRILLKRLDWSLPKAVKCIIVCCILHNFLEERREGFLPHWMQRVLDYEIQYKRFSPADENVISDRQAQILGEAKRESLAKSLFI